MSLQLLGYLINFEPIDKLQCQYRYDVGLTSAERTIKLDAITKNVEDQFESLKALLITNLACEKCCQSPLVADSKHAAFLNPATQQLWDKLVDVVDTIKNEPIHITNDHLLVVKQYFEKIEQAYRRDNVAANC
ncbi:hypothetical protein IFR04_007886 [Cadophora malorum]|uniref:Uncharacterized protein n=1 Tax=Cadophora malorum TaxID=108018 RepID=A0A8H7TC97_9HELO|nr:hypothetical protein IFR04_007886 [Cadophora malorum]